MASKGNSGEPFFVLYGFRPQGGSGGGLSRPPQESLLSKQLRAALESDENVTSGSDIESPHVRHCGSDTDDDSLCCDNDEDVFYEEELAEGFGSAPIPISITHSSTCRRRELLLKLEFLAQLDDMKRAAERYIRRTGASAFPEVAQSAQVY